MKSNDQCYDVEQMGYMGSIYFMDIVIHFPVLGNEQNLFSMFASSMLFVSDIRQARVPCQHNNLLKKQKKL